MDPNLTCMVGETIPEPEHDPYLFQDFDNPGGEVTRPDWEIGLKIYFYVIAMLLDLIGNSLVISIILLNRKMRTTTNFLILNLAVSDLMVGLFCMWVHLGNQITSNWPFGPFMCKYSTFTQVMSVTASVLTLTIISIERFMAVVFPFRGHWSPLVTGIIIACIWLAAIATGAPHLFVRKQYILYWRDGPQIWCQENWPFVYKNEQCVPWQPDKVIYYFVEGVVMYFLPIAIMLVTYSVIAYKLLTRKAPGSLIKSTITAQEKAKRKVTKMLIIVVVAFIICWTPQQVMLLYDVLQTDPAQEKWYSDLRYVAIFIAYFCSALNPILYGGFNENFRNGFLEAFKCLLIQKRNKIGPETIAPQGSKRNPDKCTDKISIVSRVRRKQEPSPSPQGTTKLQEGAALATDDTRPAPSPAPGTSTYLTDSATRVIEPSPSPQGIMKLQEDTIVTANDTHLAPSPAPGTSTNLAESSPPPQGIMKQHEDIAVTADDVHLAPTPAPGISTTLTETTVSPETKVITPDVHAPLESSAPDESMA